MNDLTVCITNFKRASYLKRAIQSCKDAGITKLVVSAMDPGPEEEEVLHWGESLGWSRYFVTITVDLGCHENWVRAAYFADTKRVIILHDDDILLPDLGPAYLGLIKPALDKGAAGLASWRAHVHRDDGTILKTEYFTGPTRVLPSAELEKFLLRRGRLSLSPVVSILDREVLINALKEGDKVLVDKHSYLHPGMLLGTEILCYLRHCSTFPRWLYVDQLLSGYGSHAGSGTVQAEQNREIPKLTVGYDVARLHYEENKRPPTTYEPRIILVHSAHYGEGEEAERIKWARRTWDYHFKLNQMMELPVPDGTLPRSAKDIGDNKPFPFLRDMLDRGCKFAMPGDIVAYANADLAFTTNAHTEIIKGVKDGNGVCVAWRRTMKFDPHRLYPNCKNGKWDGGVDLIAVTPEWWSCHSIMMPDMLIGRETWDWVARVYAERASNHKCYIDNHFYHYPHESMLKREGWKHPSQLHNLGLAKRFFGAIGDHRAVKMLAAHERMAAST